MRKIKNMKTICLGLVALALIISLNIGDALAYFTNNKAVTTKKALELGFAEAEIEEKVIINGNDARKVVWIQNTGDYPCYVRVRAYAGQLIQNIQYKPNPNVEGLEISEYTPLVEGTWSEVQADGWCYYSQILPATENPNEPKYFTKPIEVNFTLPEGTDPLNVIIVQEATPVLYDSNGNPYADWDAQIGNPTEKI